VANGGTLGGFFDVFAWREPGEVRFDEAKVGPDRIRDTQRMFVEKALRFRRLEEFTIIEITLNRRLVAAPSFLVGWTRPNPFLRLGTRAAGDVNRFVCSDWLAEFAGRRVSGTSAAGGGELRDAGRAGAAALSCG
jgi:hypothetical protein